MLMPHGPWPAHTKRPSTGPTGPTNGRPSTDCGRAHMRRSISSAPSMAGRNSTARRSSRGAMRSRVRLARQERRAERAHAAGAGEAEQRRRLALELGRCARGGRRGAVDRVDLVLLDDVSGRRPVETQLERHAPCRVDRRPRTARIDQRGRPGPGRHQDRIGPESGAVARTGRPSPQRLLDHRPHGRADQRAARRAPPPAAPTRPWSEAGGIG